VEPRFECRNTFCGRSQSSSRRPGRVEVGAADGKAVGIMGVGGRTGALVRSTFDLLGAPRVSVPSPTAPAAPGSSGIARISGVAHAEAITSRRVTPLPG